MLNVTLLIIEELVNVEINTLAILSLNVLLFHVRTFLSKFVESSELKCS